MRRTKSRRRFHTARVIRGRRARALSWGVHPEHLLESGRYESRDPHFGCPVARCSLCHWDKLDPSRRARANRAWQG
jgi:hypothetical protein